MTPLTYERAVLFTETVETHLKQRLGKTILDVDWCKIGTSSKKEGGYLVEVHLKKDPHDQPGTHKTVLISFHYTYKE